MARTRPQAGSAPLFEDSAGDVAARADLAAAPELAAPAPEPVSHAAPAASPRRLGLMPVALVGALVGAGLWGAWVTKNVLAETDMPPIARVQLSGLVGEYVQAQARSATPPEQVTAETRGFMAEIQRNLEARGASGQIVLVGEAVLAGNVPDITAELRREVYRKVRMPQPAQAQAGDVMGAMRAAMAEPQGMAHVPSGNLLDAPGN